MENDVAADDAVAQLKAHCHDGREPSCVWRRHHRPADEVLPPVAVPANRRSKVGRVAMLADGTDQSMHFIAGLLTSLLTRGRRLELF